MRNWLFVVASVLVSAVSLAIILRDIPLQDVASAIADAELVWVGLALFTIFNNLLARAIRWRGLLGQRIPTRDAFLMMGITFTLNQLPLRAGEAARSVLATRYDIPLFTAATSIIIERLLDVLIVVLMIAFAVTQLPDVDPQVTRGAGLFGFFGVVGFALLLGFARFPQVAHGLLSATLRLLPFLKALPLRDWLSQTLDGLRPLTDWRLLGFAVLWTVIAWVSSLSTVYLLTLSFGIEDSRILLTLLSVSLAALSIAIPVNIASIGLFEGAVALAGQLVRIPSLQYTALGFLYHGVTVLGYLLCGIPALVLLGVSVRDVRQPDDAQTAPPD